MATRRESEDVGEEKAASSAPSSPDLTTSREHREERLERMRARRERRDKARSESIERGAAAATPTHHASRPMAPRPSDLPLVRPVALRPFGHEAYSTSNRKNIVQQKRRKRPASEHAHRKYKVMKKNWYHGVAAKNRLGSICEHPLMSLDEDEGGPMETTTADAATSSTRSTGIATTAAICHRTRSPRQHAKQELLDALNASKGDSTTPAFRLALENLLRHYQASHFNPHVRPQQDGSAAAAHQLEGIGISANKPTFPGCIGFNAQGDPLYKLGTMSFEMFCPTQLVASIQGTFALIDMVDNKSFEEVKHVPENLLAEVRFGRTPLRTYNIVTPFTIEPWRADFGDDSPNKTVDRPIHGVMTTYGYLHAYPAHHRKSAHHRFSVWFTGGSLEVDGAKNEKWFQIFDNGESAPPKRTAAEAEKLEAAKLFMGAHTNDEMDEDGAVSYTLSKPKASHIDLIYLDKTMQILRGSSGTVYVHVRIPGSQAVHESACVDEMLPSRTKLLAQEESFNDDDGDGSNDGDVDRSQEHRPMEQGTHRGVGHSDMTSKAERSRVKLRRTVSESNLQIELAESQSHATIGSGQVMKEPDKLLFRANVRTERVTRSS